MKIMKGIIVSLFSFFKQNRTEKFLKLHTIIIKQHDELFNICEDLHREIINREEEIEIFKSNIQIKKQMADMKLNERIEATSKYNNSTKLK